VYNVVQTKGRELTLMASGTIPAKILCVPKTLNPSIMVMKSAKDGA
jgi:hypothetical protein